MLLKLISTRPEVPNVTSFMFEPETPVLWKAGQFMRYHLEDPNPDERRFDRFFTIAAAPFEGHLMVTTRFVPDDGSTFKKDLRSLNIEDSIEAKGPFGSFVVEDPGLDYVFLAGGIGITPFRAILLDLDHKHLPINVTLLYASRNLDIIFKDELEAIAQRNPNLKIHYIIDPEKINEETIRNRISDFGFRIFYLSGPQPMVEVFVPMLEGMGVLREKIKTDFFPGYASI